MASSSALGAYTRVSKLGAGTFASAHLVRHNDSQKLWVMKRIPCKHMRAANAALVEVKVLMSVAHAGIVGYRDFFLDSDSEDNIVICLLMEHCADGDLWEPIAAAQRKKATMDMARCTVWLLQLIAALRYLHARDVLHRDIKPENIFLTQDGVVCKLGDFGLAKVSSGEHVAQQANTQCGTPDYMAPEVLEGSEYSRPADVFSLGGVVYALVCSHLPKMLAMKLGQGKALEWYSPRVEGPSGKLDGVEAPPLAATRRELRSLVGASMLLAAPAARITLDDLAARVAKLPAVATLNGDALAVATAAMAPPPAAAAPAVCTAFRVRLSGQIRFYLYKKAVAYYIVLNTLYSSTLTTARWSSCPPWRCGRR